MLILINLTTYRSAYLYIPLYLSIFNFTGPGPKGNTLHDIIAAFGLIRNPNQTVEVGIYPFCPPGNR